MNEKLFTRANSASSIVIFDPVAKCFIQMNFGSGDNLDAEDIDNGFDNYVNFYTAEIADGADIESVKRDVRNAFYADDCAFLDEVESDGLVGESSVIDGGMMLFKSDDYFDDAGFDRFNEKILKECLDYLDMSDAEIQRLELVFAV